MIKMDCPTSTKEITERNSRIIVSLESELNAVEQVYSSDMNIIKERKDKDPNLKNYASSKVSALNAIQSEFEKDNIEILDSLKKKLAGEKVQYEKSIGEFDNDSNKANLKYNSSVCESVLKYFYQSSPLIEKRIKDASEFVDNHEVMPKDYEEAREGLNKINPRMRKVIKGAFWTRIFADGEKKARALVKEFETKKAEKEAGERYHLIIPIWLGVNYSDNEICNVEILSPIAKTSNAKAKIEDAILDEAMIYDEDLNDANKDLISCMIKIPKNKLNDLKMGIEKRISDSLGKFNIKTKIYETHLKFIQPKCMSIVRVEHSYSLDEVSKMKNMKKTTLYAMVGGYGAYKNHPIRQHCFKETGAEGKQVYRIKEQGLSLLDKQTNEIPADKKVVSVKEANQRLGYNDDSTVCYTYLKNGKLESVKAGSHSYITEASLNNFISTHRKSEKSGRWLSLSRDTTRASRKESLPKYA